jgi:hypothetical protein
VRSYLGRGLQIVGLITTGAVCVRAFGGDVSEGAMFAYGFGGFGVFWAGTLIRGRR